MAQIKLAEYTFDSTSTGTNMPTLIPNTITMTTEDVVISDTVTKRIVYIDNAVMPTQIKMNGSDILEVYYLNIDSNITSMNRLFHYSGKLTYVNTENWDTRNVTDFGCAFEACGLTGHLDLSHLNTGSVIEMYYVFCNTSIKSVNLNGWDMSKVTSCRSMFTQCYSLETVDMTLSTNLSTCSSFLEMFSGCKKLKTIKGTDTWKIQNATDFSKMFNQCNSLQNIKGLEDWNVSKVTNFDIMFYGCSSLTKLDLRNWVTSSATTFQNMFHGCSNLEELRVDNFDYVKSTITTPLGSMFQECKKLKTINLNNLTNKGLGNVLNVFYNCESLEYISMQNFVWGNCNSLQGLFTNCKSLKYLDFTTFDGSTIATTTTSLRLTSSFNGVTCPIYYNSNMCTTYDTELTSKSNAIDVQGRLMAVYDFNNTVTTSNSAYPTLTGSTVTKTIDTQGSESYITHRVISVDVMPTEIKFSGTVIGLLNVDYLAVASSCTKLTSLFADCVRLSSVNAFGWDTQNVTDLSSMFDDCSQLIEIDLSQCNFKNVKNLYGTFNYCQKLETLHLPTTFTTNLISLGRAFWCCSKLSTITGLSEIDTSKVSNFDRTFEEATSLMEIDLSKWNTSSGTGSTNMFSGWTSDQIVYVHDTNWTINTSSYNATFVRRLSTLLARYTFDNSVSDCLPTITGITSADYLVSDIVNSTITTRLITSENVLPTRYLFKGIKSLTRLEYLEMSEVTNMQDMLSACSNLEYLDVSQWNTSKVTSMYYGFIGCGKLTEIIGIEDLDVSNCTNLSCTFESCSGLISLDLSKWNVTKCTLLNQMFYRCTSLVSVNLSGWITTKNTRLDNLFSNCTNLTEIIGLEEWDTSNVTNMSNIFNNCRKITSIEMVRNWNTSKVTEMAATFSTMTSLTSLEPILNWDTSKVTSMANIFSWISVESFSFANWDTSKVRSMYYMLAGLLLDGWDLTNLNTSSVTNMENMFESCTCTKTLDLSHFITDNATSMKYMFTKATLTKLIGTEKWNTDKVTNMLGMFNDTKTITEINLSSFNTSLVTGCTSLVTNSSIKTVYYDSALWTLDKFNSPTVTWIVTPIKNNGYWLDMSNITQPATITMTNPNNLTTSEIVIDWGDGTRNSELTHAYSTAGQYVIATNLYHDTGAMKPYLTKAHLNYSNGTINGLLFQCPNVKEFTITDNFINEINSSKTFYNMDRAFNGCYALEYLPSNFTQIDITNVSGISSTFSYSGFKELDFTGWTNHKISNWSGAFYSCQDLEKVNFGTLDMTPVTDMSTMFGYCSKLTEINVGTNWNTSNVTNMGGVFNGCKALTSLDVSNWNFEKCTAINQFIRETTKLVDFNMSGVTFGATSVNFQNFAYQSGVQNVNMSNITTAGKVYFESPFYGCSKLKTINFSNSHFKPSGIPNMFYGCKELTSLDLSMLDTSLCTTFSALFYGCTKLSSLNITSWNTSSCGSILSTFNGCSSLTSLDLSSWDFSNIAGMLWTFNDCKSLLSLNLSSPTMKQNFTNLYGSFQNCNSLQYLDISNLDVTDDVDTTTMFNGATKLSQIGLLYSSASTINKIASLVKTPTTIYYQDADPTQLTPVEGVTFKKYQTPTTIQLPPHIQLHSFPDGTRDEVDIKTGILTRNVGCIVLDGSEDENWKYYVHNDNGYYMQYNKILDETEISSTLIPLSYSKGIINKQYITPTNLRHNEYGFHASRGITICAENSDEVKNILNQFPITVSYKLNTPTTEQLILNYNNSCDYGRILPTGMCDKYDVVNSMYTQTMTSILLDGVNTWDAMEEFENTVKFTATGTTVGVENLNMLGAGGLYCDNDLFPNINDDSDVPHCRVDETGNKFYIYVDKEMLMSPDLIGWQIWLQANNFNLIYELAEHLTYVKPYEELDPTQARWEGMDCMRDGAIKYHTNSPDNITIYPTLEYVAPSINNFEVTMLEPNTDYTIYAEGINANDTINLGGTDINFNNGTVYTSGDNQWLRIDNNDSFYNMVITKGDTTGEVVPYFEGMTSVENPKINVPCKNLFILQDYDYIASWNGQDSAGKDQRNVARKSENGTITFTSPSHGSYAAYNIATGEYFYAIHGADIFNYDYAKTQTMVEGAGTYTIQMDINHIEGMSPIIYVYYDDDKLREYRWQDMSLTVEKKINFIAVSLWYEGQIVNFTISNIQVEKGEVATDYVRGGGSNVSYTDLKLRSLPNGVKDTINVVTGEYVQRVGEVVLDGSQKIENTYNVIGKTKGFYYPPNMISLTGLFVYDYPSLISCSHFNVRVILDQWDEKYKDEEFISVADDGRVAVRLQTTKAYTDEEFYDYLSKNPITILYPLPTPIITKLDPQTLLAYKDGTINLSSDTGLLPTTHYTVPSTNTFHLPSMKTGTRYTLKYPSASGSITIGDINYSISSDSMLFTTPLKINGDTSAIIFSDTNPENVVLLEGAYNKREVPFFTGVKSVKNPNITIIDQLSTESTTYNCETEIELRGLPNGVADKLDIIKGKLTTNVGIRAYQDGDENLPNIWTDGYETVYALSSPVVTNVTIDRPTVTTNSLIDLTSDYLIPQLNYRAPSSNNFPLDLLQPNQTYTLYADTLTSGSYILGGTRTGVYSQPHTITLGDMTDNLLTFNGDLGLSNVMLVKGNSLKTTLPPYFLGIRSVTDGHLLVEGMAGETNEITFDEGIVLRDCNGVKDFIDLMTCTLTKRTGEITLTGAEGWYRADNESTTDYNVFKLTLGGLKEALVMCDTLQSVFDTKMMNCIHAHTNELCIVIANSTIGGNTVNALKSWLNQHPTTVVYQLRTPLEVQLENTWTTLPPTSYSNQTEISSTVSTSSLKPMISVTIATTTLEEIVASLEAQNAELEAENMATMLALTSVYETIVAPMTVPTTEPQVATYGLRRSAEPIGMSVSPMGMVYAKLVSKGFKSIDEVPYNLQAEVMYALRGME